MKTRAQQMWRDVALNRVIASSLVTPRLRCRLLKAYGLAVTDVRMAPHAFIGSSRLSIGDDTRINYGCFFNTTEPITIGSRCNIGMQAMFLTATHELAGHDRRAGPHVTAPIVVEDGTWIGARVTVLPGVTIGQGCVIAAGAMVTSDCAPDGLYAGVPARRVRDL